MSEALMKRVDELLAANTALVERVQNASVTMRDYNALIKALEETAARQHTELESLRSEMPSDNPIVAAALNRQAEEILELAADHGVDTSRIDGDLLGGDTLPEIVVRGLVDAIGWRDTAEAQRPESLATLARLLAVLNAKMPAADERVEDPFQQQLVPLFARAVRVLAEAEFRWCWKCGCSEHDACSPPCSWAEPDLCSACAATAAPPPDPTRDSIVAEMERHRAGENCTVCGKRDPTGVGCNRKDCPIDEIPF